MTDDWIYKAMAPELRPLAKRAAEAFCSQMAALEEGVKAAGGDHNDIVSAWAHVWAFGLKHVTDDLKAHTARLKEGAQLPTEAALGIFLNDVAARFWALKR